MGCTATDEDGGPITYSIFSGSVINLSVNPLTGSIRISSLAVGIHEITVIASDGQNSIEHSFTITVNAIPDEPDDHAKVSNETTDSDEDGIPDWWESLYGLDSNNLMDAFEDMDNDNITNLDEFIGRSSPSNFDQYPSQGDNDDPEVDKEAEEIGDWEVNSTVLFLFILLIFSLILLFLIGRKKMLVSDETIEE
jgi:hypothetical protein